MNDVPAKKPRHLILIGACIAIAALIAGWYFHSTEGNSRTNDSATLTRPQDATFAESLSGDDQLQLEGALKTYIEQERANGNVSHISLFFRDLNNGPIINIEDRTEFYPASLLKLPLAMAFYKVQASDPGFLQNQIEYSGPNGVSIENYPSEVQLQPGTIYSLKQLIELMLKDSNNDAAAILSQYINREAVDRVYQELGVRKVNNYDTYTTDVKFYSSFFRTLYNVSYLDRNSSEELLQMLTKTTFDYGLVAGVPEGVRIAHKFGERTLAGQESSIQLHDCGIVYVPEKNYILCVMTQGDSYEQQAAVIAQISKLVYEEIAQNGE
jgi:beta-lactamase class A